MPKPKFSVVTGSRQTRRARIFVVTIVLVLLIFFLDSGWPGKPRQVLRTPGGSHDEDLRPVGPEASPAEQTSSDEQADLEAVESRPDKSNAPDSSIEENEPKHDKAECVPFEALLKRRPGPHSAGKREFPYVRPPPECRTFHLPAMEALIDDMRGVIKDPDLFRLFENAYPMTLDTMVKWRGYANESDPKTGEFAVTDQELAYVITGDIDAMWLRDSASQIYSYLPLLEASSDPDSLASLWRGLINAHSRYIIISPYCHSFQPPPESGIPPTMNGAYAHNNPRPAYDPSKVFDCKWELDSLASFLQMSVGYFQKTEDYRFFQKYNWVAAVDAAVKAAAAMRLGTYAADGRVEKSAWTFTGWTNRGSETLTNDGLGNPSKENGMVRTAFRPSDDATIFQFLVPANMMFAVYLESASEIMDKLENELAPSVAKEMRELAEGIRRGINKDAIVERDGFGKIFAYEVDGFGSANLMDDANIPSLLAMPLWNFTKPAYDLPEQASVSSYEEVYRNTRRFVLSEHNSYFMRGSVISAVGGPHVGPGKAWPMAAAVAGLTAYDPVSGLDDAQEEVEKQVRMIMDSTAGSGVLHESVNTSNEKDYTRDWFGWANGLFGELVLRMYEDDKRRDGQGLLGKSWQ